MAVQYDILSAIRQKVWEIECMPKYNKEFSAELRRRLA